MKKVVILLFVVCAFLAFSCNKYCRCKRYIDGELDRSYKGEWVKESNFSCEDHSTLPEEIEGRVHETKCK